MKATTAKLIASFAARRTVVSRVDTEYRTFLARCQREARATYGTRAIARW
jgi:hypothetical protein